MDKVHFCGDGGFLGAGFMSLWFGPFTQRVPQIGCIYNGHAHMLTSCSEPLCNWTTYAMYGHVCNIMCLLEHIVGV